MTPPSPDVARLHVTMSALALATLDFVLGMLLYAHFPRTMAGLDLWGSLWWCLHLIGIAGILLWEVR